MVFVKLVIPYINNMFLIFDIGGTKMRLAVSPDGVTINEPVLVDTPDSFEEGMARFEEVYRQVSAGYQIQKAAGGMTGVFSRKRHELLMSPHLPHWSGYPVKRRVEEITGVEVLFENDTGMVGLGEALSGAGRGYEIVAYITISTGVGGSRIVNGKIDISTLNFEPGHQIIDADGSIMPDAKAFEDGESLGHWESMISGTAMENRFHKHPSEIIDEAIWQKQARLVAYGLNNVIVHWSPDIVVIGGGMMKSPGLKIDDIKSNLDTILKIYPVRPDIKKAELGDFGGLYGALHYLRQHSDG